MSGQRAKGSKRVSAGSPVYILGLEKEYENLHRVYSQLEHRERDLDETLGTTGTARNQHEISGVDFSLELTPLPPDMLMKTDSEANKFAMLVWRMLDACESGSMEELC